MLLSPVEIKDAILMALSAIRANKLRAGLTVLGVMVGVSSVIGLASIIGGLNGQMEREIDQLGSNVIMVTKNDVMVDHDELDDSQRNRQPIAVGEEAIAFAGDHLKLPQTSDQHGDDVDDQRL